MSSSAFLETSGFQKWVRKNRLRASVERLKQELVARPTIGDVIPGAGGLRKVRMAGSGRGKRGGFRIIYASFLQDGLIALLAGYDKGDREDLSADELRMIRIIAQEIADELENHPNTEISDGEES